MRLDALAKAEASVDPRWRGLVRVARPEFAGVRVCDFAEDSRTVLPGSLFVARAGRSVDGRCFMEEAARAGAAAVLTDEEGAASAPAGLGVLVSEDVPLAAGLIAERFYGEPSSRLNVIGVTGTNGKTTVAHLVHQLLNAAGLRCGLLGTVNVDDGRGVSRSDMTTPACGETSQALASMLEAGCTHCVMEVSSHALDQKRVDGVRFDTAIFTNLTGDHLDYHGSMEAYAAAKARLFGLLDDEGLAIVNADDAWAEAMLHGCRARVLRARRADSAQAPTADVLVRTGGDETLDGTPVELGGRFFESREANASARRATLPLLGSFNRLNFGQAAAAAMAAGASVESVVSATPRLVAPEGRLQRVAPGVGADEAADVTVLIDFAHSDDALRNSLSAVRPAVPRDGRLVVVFGCGGDRDRTKRPRMGAAASELADRVIVTSDNPRSERPSDIVSEVLEGVPRGRRGEIEVHVDRGRAIATAIETARAGDVIVIAGKGHEKEQIIQDVGGSLLRLPFDDAEQARRGLRRLAEIRRAATDGRGTAVAGPADEDATDGRAVVNGVGVGGSAAAAAPVRDERVKP